QFGAAVTAARQAVAREALRVRARARESRPRAAVTGPRSRAGGCPAGGAARRWLSRVAGEEDLEVQGHVGGGGAGEQIHRSARRRAEGVHAAHRQRPVRDRDRWTEAATRGRAIEPGTRRGLGVERTGGE